MLVGGIIGYILAPREGKVVTEVVEKTVEVPVEIIKEVIKEVVVEKKVYVKQACAKKSWQREMISAERRKDSRKKNRLSVGLGSSYVGLDVKESAAQTVVKEKREADYMIQYQRSLTDTLSLGVAVTGSESIFGVVGLDF